MKVWVAGEEEYPVYRLSNVGYDEEIELTHEEHARVVAAEKEWNAVQKMLFIQANAAFKKRHRKEAK